MNTIRYYSKFGHTKSMVDAVKDLMDSEPRTVEAPLEGKADVLYIGAGVLMGKVDKRVMDFIATLTPETVGRPFSPYSDTNVARDGLRAALQSPLFAKLREANNGSWQHTGGCTLYEHREEVEQMLGNKE